MWISTIVSAILLATSQLTLVTASAIPTSATCDAVAPRSEGYIKGDGPIVKGNYHGHDFELKGTIQEVYAQLEALYPGLEANTTMTEEQELFTRSQTELQARNKYGLICNPVPGQGWGYGTYDGINAGITMLRGNAAHSFTIYPRRCELITCFMRSGIELCNDNNYAISPNKGYLASYAQDLVNYCTVKNGPVWRVGGQEFDTDHYNIIARDC